MAAEAEVFGFPDLLAGFAGQRRRAKGVCRRCHEKKIKCDLDRRRGEGFQACINCVQTKSECRPRPSRRNLHHSQQARDKLSERQNPGARVPSTFPVSDTLNNFSFVNPPPNSYGLLFPPSVAQPGVGRGLVAHSMSQEPDYPAMTPYQIPLPPQSSLDAPSNHSDNAVRSSNLHAAEHQTPRDTDHSFSHNPQASYLGESGYMPFLSQEQNAPARHSGGPVTINIQYSINPLSTSLRKSYTEIVLQHYQIFCPALDRSVLDMPEFEDSLALQQSIGLLGSAIQPSLLDEDGPATYYERAKALIQGGYEQNPLAALIAVMLFYYWSAAPPNVVSMNGGWWWLGLAVRQAQEIGLHREVKADQTLRAGESIGLRRRIWWTLFARERLTSICQGRPYIINLQDCDAREPTPDDFPHPKDRKTIIFIQWIRLCLIVGRVGDHLRRSPSGTQVAHGLLHDLREWAHAIPETLRLPFGTAVTSEFDADLYQLHLPYLSCVTLLHLEKSSQSIPTAYTAAILSASCTARIFEEFLVRGSLRFLQGMAGWYIAIALLALLHGLQVKRLEHAVDTHIRVLRIALREMAKRWGSAKMYDTSIEKLLNTHARDNAVAGSGADEVQDVPVRFSGTRAARDADPVSKKSQDGFMYFPGTTTNTSPLFKILLASDQHTPFPELEYGDGLACSLYDIFDNPLDGINYDLSEHLTGWGMTMDG